MIKFKEKNKQSISELLRQLHAYPIYMESESSEGRAEQII